VANRKNALQSTGPRTDAGKKRSSANALSHGLARAVTSDRELAYAARQVLEELIRTYALPPQAIEAAQQLAEAEIDLRRIRGATVALVQKTLEASTCADAAPGTGTQELADARLAAVLCDLTPEFKRLQRYEHRAASRRKSAVHALMRLLTVAIRQQAWPSEQYVVIIYE
jgi:hypothetical protein